VYSPAHFRVDDRKALLRFIKENPFGILISSAEGVPHATHIPFELEESGDECYLLGHVSAVNPHRYFLDGNQVLAVFQGPHAYVSASWYGHANVSTWNYISVHVSGPVSQMQDVELDQHLRRLMAHYDKDRSTEHLEHLSPQEYLNNLKGVFGFRIKAEKIEGNWKMSQNRNDADFVSIVLQLEASTIPAEREVAEVMKSIRPQLF
jgi:transcriptional regulator